jgi:hypothetical protein
MAQEGTDAGPARGWRQHLRACGQDCERVRAVSLEERAYSCYAGNLLVGLGRALGCSRTARATTIVYGLRLHTAAVRVKRLRLLWWLHEFVQRISSTRTTLP